MRRTMAISVALLFAAVLCIAAGDAAAQGKTYKVGDRGPAGGWIFYDKGHYSDGWRYFEAAPADVLSRKVTWHEAVRLCSEYRGGGYGGWGLPGKRTLDLMIGNLRGLGAGFSIAEYWSQTQNEHGSVWSTGFTGSSGFRDKNRTNCARCARQF